MGLFDFVKKGAQELFIARPDDAKDLLVYKWPDPTIPMKAQLTVARGRDRGLLQRRQVRRQGRSRAAHARDLQHSVPLALIDNFTGGNVLKAEVWFVTIREIARQAVRRADRRRRRSQVGRAGAAAHPRLVLAQGRRSEEGASTSSGCGSWSTDDEFEGWFNDQVKKTFRDKIAEMLVKQHMPLLDVTSGAYTEEIETDGGRGGQAAPGRLRDAAWCGWATLVIDMKDEDEVKLKSFYTDAAQLRMMGGNCKTISRSPPAKPCWAPAKGMAKGGGGGDGGNPMLGGAGLGVGLGMAQMFNQQQQHGQVGMQQAPSVPQGGVGSGDLRQVRRHRRAREVLRRVRRDASPTRNSFAPSAASRSPPAPSSAPSAAPSSPDLPFLFLKFRFLSGMALEALSGRAAPHLRGALLEWLHFAHRHRRGGGRRSRR